jgi:hypothetical protein
VIERYLLNYNKGMERQKTMKGSDEVEVRTGVAFTGGGDRSIVPPMLDLYCVSRNVYDV